MLRRSSTKPPNLPLKRSLDSTHPVTISGGSALSAAEGFLHKSRAISPADDPLITFANERVVPHEQSNYAAANARAVLDDTRALPMGEGVLFDQELWVQGRAFAISSCLLCTFSR